MVLASVLAIAAYRGRQRKIERKRRRDLSAYTMMVFAEGLARTGFGWPVVCEMVEVVVDDATVSFFRRLRENYPTPQPALEALARACSEALAEDRDASSYLAMSSVERRTGMNPDKQSGSRS
jgi:hypothetical protein